MDGTTNTACGALCCAVMCCDVDVRPQTRNLGAARDGDRGSWNCQGLIGSMQFKLVPAALGVYADLGRHCIL